MSYFPMMVNLEGVRVLVIGGGEYVQSPVEERAHMLHST